MGWKEKFKKPKRRKIVAKKKLVDRPQDLKEDTRGNLPAKLRRFTVPMPEADLSGLARFTHMIRSPDDPERPDRIERRKGSELWSEEQWKDYAAPHLSLKKSSKDEWKDNIMELMSDGKPRTFNHMCVVIGNITADIAGHEGYPPEEALWELVREAKLVHTVQAPILFWKMGAIWCACVDWREESPKGHCTTFMEGQTLKEVQKWMSKELEPYWGQPKALLTIKERRTLNPKKQQALLRMRAEKLKEKHDALYYEHVESTSIWLNLFDGNSWHRPTEKESWDPSIGGHQAYNNDGSKRRTPAG